MHSLAVGEEETLARRVMFVKDAALTHKALVHQRRVADLYSRSDDEIAAFNTAAQTNRSRFV